MRPFFGWLGGKTQLLPKLLPLVPRHRTYFEPFLGAGALLLALAPERAVVTDAARPLFNCWSKLREDPFEFNVACRHLNRLARRAVDPAEFFYRVRREFNEANAKGDDADFVQAARFYCLIRLCFNAVYRVNRRGEFNTPYNGRTPRKFNADPRELAEISEFLRGHVVLDGSMDFEGVMDQAVPGDFVFVDSPYLAVNENSHVNYATEFSDDDHERLARAVDRLTDRGVACLCTNAAVPAVHDLYPGSRYSVTTVDVRRSCNSKASERQGREVIIMNYELDGDGNAVALRGGRSVCS